MQEQCSRAGKQLHKVGVEDAEGRKHGGHLRVVLLDVRHDAPLRPEMRHQPPALRVGASCLTSADREGCQRSKHGERRMEWCRGIFMRSKSRKQRLLLRVQAAGSFAGQDRLKSNREIADGDC